MLRVSQILPDGHEALKPGVLDYMKSMAERHGFTVLDEDGTGAGKARRVRIDYEYLRDPIFLAILEDV